MTRLFLFPTPLQVSCGQKQFAIDNDSLAWNSWANNIWPSIYLIDKNGFVRYWWYGELNWQGAESEKLLAERIRELILELVAAPDTPMN